MSCLFSFVFLFSSVVSYLPFTFVVYLLHSVSCFLFSDHSTLPDASRLYFFCSFLLVRLATSKVNVVFGYDFLCIESPIGRTYLIYYTYTCTTKFFYPLHLVTSQINVIDM
jgi:hypothetical protein